MSGSMLHAWVTPTLIQTNMQTDTEFTPSTSRICTTDFVQHVHITDTSSTPSFFCHQTADKYSCTLCVVCDVIR